MDFEKELERIADQYRGEGYVVRTHPDQDALPAFAAGFDVDLLATRRDGGVLVEVKRDRAELASDPEVSRQAAVTNAQPGWRYDLVVLEPNHARRSGYREPSPEQIEQMLGEAERVAGLSPQAAFVLAWAGLEASMRRLGQRAGVGGWPGTQPPTLIRELYASGRISPDDFRRLEASRVLRTEVVHGLAPSATDAGRVQEVVGLARRLLAESEQLQTVAG
jgi:REase_AHJR-like